MEHVDFQVEADALNLGLRIDDQLHTLNVVRRGDPSFWLSIDKEGAFAPVITDFKRSKLTAAEMAVALAFALDGLKQRPEPLKFHVASTDLKLLEQEYRSILGSYAKLRQSFLSDLRMEDHRGMTSVFAHFES